MTRSSRSSSRRSTARTRRRTRRRVSAAWVPSGPRPAVDPSDVRLERGAGAPGRGGEPGGSYWRVFVGDASAGTVFINIIDEPPLGQHASIQIKINKNWQGRGVGRRAYRLASEACDHDTVYAHMAKSNIASRKAAEHAGYKLVDDVQIRQLLMKWTRSTARSNR